MTADATAAGGGAEAGSASGAESRRPRRNSLTLTSTPDKLDHIIEHLLEFKAAGVTHVCLELKKHQAHGIKILGEQVLPAIR